MQEFTPTTIVDNLTATGGKQMSAAEESVLFMTRSEVEAILWKEKEKNQYLTSV